MSKIVILSDIHAGFGADPDVRQVQRVAMIRAVNYLKDQRLVRLILNGDTTDHLNNGLSHETDREASLVLLAPLARLMEEHRGEMKTVCLAGNTDWPIAEPTEEDRQVFFDYTGFNPELVERGTMGGLADASGEEDWQYLVTHGHTLDPKQWGHEGEMTADDYDTLLQRITNPDPDLLRDISAVTGAHREKFLKAQRIGNVVKRMPWFVRRPLSSLAKKQMNAPYAKHMAGLLRSYQAMSDRRTVGFMGHTHAAGITEVDGFTIVNTGTAGAKPNPLESFRDPKAHLAVIDPEHGTYQLVQTFNAARPGADVKVVGGGKL